MEGLKTHLNINTKSSEISEDFLLKQITKSDYLISVINFSFGFLTLSSFSSQSFSESL